MSVPDYLLQDSSVAERCPEGAGITLYTTSGAVFSDFLERPTGMPGNPVSTLALLDKFINCLNFKVERPQAKSVAEELLTLEKNLCLPDLIEKLAMP